MSKGPGRKNTGVSPSRKRELSSDAQIIVALLKKQPLTKEEICNETKMKENTFSRNISFLKKFEIIKMVDQKHALWNFDPLETKIEAAFLKLFENKNTWYASSDLIVSEVGLTWDKIEDTTLKIAKKLGSKITPQNGKYRFYKPESFESQKQENAPNSNQATNNST